MDAPFSSSNTAPASEADEQRGVSEFISRLGEGDPQAAELLWDEYFEKLVRYARRRLEGMSRRAADEEDVAISAFHSFVRGMEAGRFKQVDDRDNMWKLLVTITARKACAQRRREMAAKRGGGSVRGESVFQSPGDGAEGSAGIEKMGGREPTPELSHIFVENCREMLDCLQDETLKQVALLALEGYSATEIGQRLGFVRRTAERKLELIRKKWTAEGYA